MIAHAVKTFLYEHSSSMPMKMRSMHTACAFVFLGIYLFSLMSDVPLVRWI